MLYSSGRLTSREVRRRVRRYLEQDSLALNDGQLKVEVGRQQETHGQAKLFQLDEIRIRYVPSSWLQRFFERTMEEKCVIKHAPHYVLPFQTQYGPPVPW